MPPPTHGELASLRDAVNQLRTAQRKTDELVGQLEREVAALKSVPKPKTEPETKPLKKS